MTTVQTFIILLFSLLLLDSCSQRDDILFSASDELHYIKLFDKDNEFEICHNGFNTAVGKYEFKDDTIYLTYTENKTLTQSRDGKNYIGTENEFLTRKLFIDSATKCIRSADERNFCAFINCNKLKSKYKHKVGNGNYFEKRTDWLENKTLIKDNLHIDTLGNLYLCGEFSAYATGNLENFKPRIGEYVIELKYLIDTATFKLLEYPVFKDKDYFYSFFKMEEGGTLTVYEANKKNELMFTTYVDSLRQKKTSR